MECWTEMGNEEHNSSGFLLNSGVGVGSYFYFIECLQSAFCQHMNSILCNNTESVSVRKKEEEGKEKDENEESLKEMASCTAMVFHSHTQFTHTNII